MFIFLTLICPPSNCGYNTESLNKTVESLNKDVNELISEILSVEKDFKLMESHFEVKFGTLISEKQKNMHLLYFNLFEKKEEQETEIKNYIPDDLLNVDSNSIVRILPKIVFNDFLISYDEYSYAINQRITEMHKKFRTIRNKFTNFIDLGGVVSYKFKINEMNFENVEYKDLYYFLNKLEQQLVSIFNIDLDKMKNFLYGCDPNDKESHSYQIRECYKLILLYKRKNSSCRKQLDDHSKLDSGCRSNTNNQEKSIYFSMSRYIQYFNNDIPHLYEYHKTIPNIFPLSKTRFSIYEYLMYKNDHLGESSNVFDQEIEALFSDYFVCLLSDTERAHRLVIFHHISYSYENENECSDYLKEIKSGLQQFIRQLDVAAFN